jgi:hypothetical protein
VLGRLVVLADPDRRGSVPLAGVPVGALPPPGSIDVAVHARGKTSGEVLAALCAAARVHAETPGELVDRLGGRRLLAVVDAVDEAVDPAALVGGLLRPLIDASAGSGLRLLLGARRHLLDRLGPGAVRVDLDAEEYADPASLRAYTRSCLRETAPAGSPWHHAPAQALAAVAEAVADAAGRSFLVALITARTLASRPDLPDPADPAWRASLPATAAEAMRNDLQIRLGADARRARDLLTPLAFALGAGLPWEDLWAALASELAATAYTDEDLVWLRRNAGSYIVEAAEGGGSVYRLYHEALAEHLRDGHDPRRVHAAIAGFLTEHTPHTPDGGRDWARAHSYTRAHLATHAARGYVLDPFLDDPAYLLAAAQPALLAALPAARTGNARRNAGVYARAAHHLRDKPKHEHPAYLEMAARRVGADVLAARVNTQFPSRPWRIPVGALAERTRPPHPHRPHRHGGGGGMHNLAGRAHGGRHRQLGPHGASLGPGHRHAGRRAAHRPHRPGEGGGVRDAAGRACRGRHRQQGHDGAGLGPGHRQTGGRAADRPHRPGGGGGVRDAAGRARGGRHRQLGRHRAGLGPGHRQTGGRSADRPHRAGWGGSVRESAGRACRGRHGRL